MTDEPVPHPPIASAEDWQRQRDALLRKEKSLTRERDRLNAERRRLPMVKIGKPYEFDCPTGKKSLLDLFDGSRQLVVYHFMYGPDWEKACPGCTGFVNEIGDISMLKKRDTEFVLISRAPLAKLDAWKKEKGWSVPWYSSLESDFNFDFEVSDDKGEGQGISVFFHLGSDVYQTYRTGGRGVENATDSYALLDMTPYGRQEDFEDSPEGWPQKPTYG